MEKNLSALIDKDKNDWNALIDWDPNINESSDSAVRVRQDNIPNGIIATYRESDLIHNTSSSFSSHKFYDFNDYLPKLVLLAHMVDDEFQISVQNIFDIDKKNGIGHLTSAKTTIQRLSTETKNDDINVTTIEANNDSNSNRIEYTRGPVKLYDRALSKSENDYSNELYPTSACVLDFNRSTLTFYDINTLLHALNLFVNKVKYYQSGNIIKIVRCKNTFQNYANEGPQYADIKLNVIIKGNSKNLIGEVVFLLNPMLIYKRKEHNLYSIKRQESFIKSSLSSILPQLLDKDKQLFVAGNMGNVKKLCQMMVVNNLNAQDTMKIDDDSKETILTNICALGHVKALQFLTSIVPNELLISRLFLPNRYDQKAIEASVQSPQVFSQLFSQKIIVNKFKTDSNLIVESLQSMVSYKSNQLLKVLIAAVGKTLFAKHACMPSKYNLTMVEKAVRDVVGNIDMIRLLLSMTPIRERYKESKAWLFRLLFHLFGDQKNTGVIDEVINLLQINDLEFVTSTVFDCVYTESMKMDFVQKMSPIVLDDEKCWKYAGKTIASRIGWAGNHKTLEKFVTIVGKKAFISNIFKCDYINNTIIEYAIRRKNVEMIKKILSYNEIRQKIATNKYWLYRTLWWLFRGEYDSQESAHNIIDPVMKHDNGLNLATDDIIDLITNYQYKEIVDGAIKSRNAAWTYDNTSIVTAVGWYSNYVSLQALISIVGEHEFGKFVFMNDSINNTVLENAIRQNKIKMIKLIVSLQNVQTVYQSDSYWTHRLFWWYEYLNAKSKTETSLWKDVLTNLHLTKKHSMNLLKDYRYKEKTDVKSKLIKSAVKC